MIDYIRSRAAVGHLSGEKKSQVIAVDAEYGIGKTFFLRRLKVQLSGESAVAFVDAWSDDFVGEPLVSLSSTLKSALEPILGKPSIKSKWKDVASKTGRIAWIATKGVSKQTLKLAVSTGGVEAMEAVIGEEVVDSDALRDAIKDGLSGADKDDGSLAAELDDRILDFRNAKRAVHQLQSSLSILAKAAEQEGMTLPIIIIIDELDRCRPDYALKVLEQIKHLFSVPEVCFVLGIRVSLWINSETLGIGYS